MAMKGTRKEQPVLNYASKNTDVGGIRTNSEELTEIHSNRSGTLSNVDKNDDASSQRGQTVRPMDGPKFDLKSPPEVDPILWTRAGLDHRRRFGDQPLRKGNAPSADRMNKLPMRWGSNE